MENFPQSFEPVGSDSILEQFVQLKNFTNEKFESHDYVKTTVQELTENEKKQARDNIGAGSATINVIDNLESESTTDALSANQGRILNEKNSATNQELSLAKSAITSLNSDVSEIQGNISSINQELQKSLKLPEEMPTEIEIVAIGTNKAQTHLTAGDEITIENGVLSVNQNVLKSIDSKETIAGLNSVDISNISFSSLRDCLSYLASDLTKTYYCYIGNAQSSSFKNLVGNPNGFGNYTLCCIKPLAKLTNQNVGIYTGSVYQCIAVGNIVNKLAIGYIFNGENASNETTFSGWNVLY